MSSTSDAVHCGQLIAGLSASPFPPLPSVTTSNDVIATRHHHSLKSGNDCVYCRSDVTMTSCARPALYDGCCDWSTSSSIGVGGSAITSEPAARRASYLVASLCRDGTATSSSMTTASRLYPYDDDDDRREAVGH